MPDHKLTQEWILSGDSFMAALRRVYDGETPDEVYMLWYANSCVTPHYKDDEQ